MTAMLFEVYDALRAAGVPEDKAKDAARALSDQSALTKSDIKIIEKEMVRIEKELIIIKWMLGIVIAAVVLPLLKGILSIT